MRVLRWNRSVPYDLRDQPVPVEDVILHFGVDLRNARLSALETQTHLSQIAGVSQGLWSMVENGLAEGVRLEILARIAVSMGLELTFRRCVHPVGTGRRPPNGRSRRTAGARRIPGTRRLEPGQDWDDRDD
jgi:transcriptional regulator with XRE-family HTH domain